MRALGYFLVDATGVSSSASLEHQERTFRQYCRHHAHVPVGTFTDLLRDQSRPAYHRMLQHIRQTGRAYLLVVVDPRHLGADLEEGVRRLLELDGLGIRVVCADPSTPDVLQGMLRVWGTDLPEGARRERIREGMRARAVQGRGLGKPPYGYRIGSHGKLEPVAEEAQVVRLIHALYLEQGLGVRRVARHLNDQGVTTRLGRQWSMVTVRDILRNRAYIGTYSRFGLRVAGSHAGIVEPDDFRRVQDRMRERSPARRHPRSRVFLLSGIAYCGECGNRMMRVTRRRTWQRKDGERVRGEYHYYQCQSRTNRNQCQYHTWRAVDLEGQVLSQVRRALEQATGPAPALAGTVTRPSEEARLSSLRRRYLAYVRRAAEGGLSLGHLGTKLAALEEERSHVQQALAGHEGDAENGVQGRQVMSRRLLEEWERIAPKEQQQILCTLVLRVIVGDRQVEVVLRGAPEAGLAATPSL